MVSHPENGSDSPIGSDRDRGRDSLSVWNSPPKYGFNIWALTLNYPFFGCIISTPS